MADLDYAVLTEDLTADAAQWDRVAAVLGEAQVIAASLDLEFGAADGISFGLGFSTQYDAAQKAISDYILAGQTTMTGIAGKLRTTRDLYEAAEK